MQNPGFGFLIVLLGSFSEFGLLLVDEFLMKRLDLLQVFVGLRQVAATRGADRTDPIGDLDVAGQRVGHWC